jgi:hypothetical protein
VAGAQSIMVAPYADRERYTNALQERSRE